MKKSFFAIAAWVLTLCAAGAHAQNVGINEDGTAPNPSAMLDVKSSNKGVLIPRVSTMARLAIPNTNGMLVYDTTTNLFWYNTGAAWQSLSVGAAGWLITGNAGTDSSNFLGTTDLRPLVIKVNNQLSGWLDTLSRNTFWGYSAGNPSARDSLAGISFNYNTGIGYGALHGATSGNYNTAIGYATLFAAKDKTVRNTAIGYTALNQNTTGANNTAVGAGSLTLNTTGQSNTALGQGSLTANTTGRANTATGAGALLGNTTGIDNVAYGISGLLNNTTGNSNTAIGSVSLANNTAGSENTAIGAFADISPFSGTLTNATAIGARALVNASNKVRIGNSAVTVIEGQVPFTTPSDGRFKYQVREDVKGLNFILQLRPVTYRFDVQRFEEQQKGPSDNVSPVNHVLQAAYNEAAAIRRTGFIAQDVQKAADACGYDFSGIIKPKTDRDHYSLSYESFVVPLVKGMQEQQEIINAQNIKIERQDKELSGLRHDLDAVKKLLETLKISVPPPYEGTL